MITEELEYQNFKVEITQKVGELKEKFNKLSESNKQRFREDVKPMIQALIVNFMESNNSLN